MKGRVNDCVDFVVAKARYHQNWQVIFCGKHLKPTNKNVGQPWNVAIIDAFEKACDWLEKEPELHSISKFAEKVWEYSESSYVFTNKHQTTLLWNKYGDHILIASQGPSKGNILSLQDTAKFLIEQKFQSDRQRGDTNAEKERTINSVGNTNAREELYEPNTLSVIRS